MVKQVVRFLALGSTLLMSGQQGSNTSDSMKKMVVAATNTNSGAPRTPAQLKQSNRLAASDFLAFLGSARTNSPARSVAVNGSLAYVCSDEEVSIFDITNPGNLQLVTTALSSLFDNSVLTYCSIQRNTLVVFSDQGNSIIGNSPGITTYSLANPAAPQLLAAKPLQKRFFQNPIFVGNFAFVPTSAITFFFSAFEGQFGDLLSVDLADLSNPSLAGSLIQPQVDSTYGGSHPVLGAALASSDLVYIGGSSSTGDNGSGTGRIQVADIANPSSMKVIGRLTIPETNQTAAPLIQGSIGVSVGNTGGFVPAFGSDPVSRGNIVVTTLDTAQRRSPKLITTKITNFVVGKGGGAAILGVDLFAFAGVQDVDGNPVLLTVRTTDPREPVIQAYPLAQPFTSMQAVGNILFATLGVNGLAAFSIPGGSLSNPSCPNSVDTVLVLDRAIGGAASVLQQAKAAASSYLNNLRLNPDRIGVVAADSSSRLIQPLTNQSAAPRQAISSVTRSDISNLGVGLSTAQSELLGVRQNTAATKVIVLVSDGLDAASASTAATLSAAQSAKSAGTRIVVLHYASTSNSLMTNIASSPSDYYLVPSGQ
jgi:hypothetical protein